MTSPLGKPVADLDDFLETAPEIVVQPATEQPAPLRRRTSRTIWALLAMALLLGAAGLGYRAVGGQPATGAAAGTATSGQAPSLASGVPGFAELLLASYLTGTSGALSDFLPAPPPLAATTPGARYVTRAATIEATPVDDDYWRVVVAADVLTLADGTYHPSGLHYFQIAVVDDGGRLVAAALPARVAGPAPRTKPPRALQVAGGTATDEQQALVGDFLEALLTDRRDLDRYLSPDSAITAISPAPYQSISVTSIALFDDGSALATVDAQTAGGTIDSMQYTIRFAAGGTGPAVAALLAGPPLIGHSEQGRP